MWIKVLKGCVATGAKLKADSKVQVSEEDGQILVRNGFAEKADPPKKKAVKKNDVRDDE